MTGMSKNTQTTAEAIEKIKQQEEVLAIVDVQVIQTMVMDH